jgi:hypothetical protein
MKSINYEAPPVTFTLLGPNIFLSTLFSNTLILCSVFNVKDQVSYPNKTAVRIRVLYKDKRF